MGRSLVLVLVLALPMAGCIVDAPSGLPDLGPAAELTGGTGWIGTAPLDLDALQGKVVLIDFWTYSCINCIRTLPHLTGWWDTYHDTGFVIVGVHRPEFDFEKDRDNVIDAMDRYGIDYPVVQDNDSNIWDAYQNRFWPAKYLIDADGRVRYTHFGEGAYEQTEENIRALLREAGHRLPPPFEGSETQSERGNGVTRELYAGTWRQDDALGNPEGYTPGADVPYTLPPTLAPHYVYLDGTWHNGHEALTARTAGEVHLKFRAGGANFVVDGPVGTCVPVTLDGAPITPDDAGPDVTFRDGDTCIELQQTPRSYDFYRGPVSDHHVVFEVPFGFELYTFAFSSFPEGGTPA